MKVTLQLVIEAENGTPTTVQEVGQLEREGLQPESLGLKLDEAKDLLQALQRVLVEEQVRAALAQQAPCPQCGAVQRHKDARTIAVRTLFGILRLPSPRWYRCRCRPAETQTFSPLAELLPERTTPELLYLEAKFAGLVAYGLSAKLLGEILPLGRPLHASAVRRHVQTTAQRLEDELGSEQAMFLEGCQREWDELPRPELPLTVGLDGGYVHACAQRSKREGWFEVIAGKSMPAEGPARCFSFVQTYDTKPKRRLFELLKSQGMQANQQITFLTDGGEDVRELPLYLNPQAEHVLDWFHLAMRLTVMGQMAKGL
ncbi:MAG: ISKra4 family transposase, partial [Candidatus Dormibacteraeota bacterium]|nr:ISKra4 family transposase [Candidatus Dormibacteraeota bacterium]